MASIRLKNASVTFPLYSSERRSLTARLFSSPTGGQILSTGAFNKTKVVRALDNLSFTLEHGDRVALVGHNGAGKSTLLRLLAGIYEPSEGRVEIKGRPVPLFDASLGMDPESTGYENILLRGLFLGLSRAQIDEKTDEIAEFTELGHFLDLPLRTYSTGMRTRLAFAVSTSIVPEILLLDEGLGTGDASFFEKANRRIAMFTNQAAIVLLASHSEAMVRRMCTKAVLLEHGQVLQIGGVDEVLEAYSAHSGLRT